jgi:predicted transcriptional regulator
MVNPLSEHARLILEFVKSHPGVQQQFIEAELNIKVEEFAIALAVLQSRGLIEGKLDVKFGKSKHDDDNGIRFYPKI